MLFFVLFTSYLVFFDSQMYLVACDNNTSRTNHRNGVSDRQGRFVTFNTKDDHMEVELKFYVPFISIPVKRAWDYASGNVANINMAALIITGGMILVASIFVPAVLQLFFKKYPNFGIHMGGSSHGGEHGSDHRSDRLRPPDIWKVIDHVDRALQLYNIDSTSCMQRAVCRNVKTSTSRVTNGVASNKDKFIDAIVTNEWVNRYFEGTPWKPAILKGLHKNNCWKEFNSCKLTQGSLSNLAREFVKSLSFT